MKELIYLLPLLLLTLPGFGTCVVLRITDKDIYIGADTRTAWYNNAKPDGTKGDSGVSMDACKIKHTGKYYYGVAGQLTQKIIEAVDQVFVNARLSKDIPNDFENSLSEILKIKMNEIKSKQPDLYKKYEIETYLLEVGYCYFDGGTPKMVMLKFKVKTTPDNYKITYVPLFDRPFGMLGAQDKMGDTPEGAKMRELILENPIIGITKIIEFESELHPEGVGKDAVIVHVTGDSENWTPKVNPCNGNMIVPLKLK